MYLVDIIETRYNHEMLRLVLLALFVLVKTEDLMGVNYSFDIDFYKHFDRCDNVKLWRLVRYEDIGVKPPNNSNKGILAVGESCASSFPIIFVGGTLQVNVYFEDISQMFNLIEVFDKDDQCISRYIHRPRIEFKLGWQTITLKINKHVEGYIRFRGRSLNKILLIDSFHYTPNTTVIYGSKTFMRTISDIEEDELIFKYTDKKEDETIEGSGDEERVTEYPPSEPEERQFWNPFTIALVSFGVVVTVALVTVGAYQYGKLRARDNAPLSFEDEEPPRTVTIPRINAISSRSGPSTLNNYY